MHPPIYGICPYLEVYDMPASLGFYRDLLGFEIKATSDDGIPNWVLMELNGAQLMLNTQYEMDRRPPERDSVREKHHGDLCFYFNSPDIDALFGYFSVSGIQLKEPIMTGYGWKAIYLKDPDGFKLCFHHPVGANK